MIKRHVRREKCHDRTKKHSVRDKKRNGRTIKCPAGREKCHVRTRKRHVGREKCHDRTKKHSVRDKKQNGRRKKRPARREKYHDRTKKCSVRDKKKSSTFSFYVSRRITRQGLPTANESSGISCVTTLPAPITQRSPIVTPGQITVLPPIQQSAPTVTG